MGFLKKHAFLIISIVVVLLAGGLFVFGIKIASANSKELQTLQSTVDGVRSIQGKIVHNNEIAHFRAVAQEINTKADAMLNSINQVSNRPLLMEDYFPKPGYDDIIYAGRFAGSYIDFVNSLLGEMSAGDRPTTMEENKVREDYRRSQVGADSTGAYNMIPGAMGVYGGGGRTGQERTPEDELVDAMRKKRAESIKIYASADSLFGVSYWDSIKNRPEVDDKDSMLRRAWYTQLAAWIQKDVADSLVAMNASAGSVVDAPVKRLVEISFGGDVLGGGASTATTPTSRGTTGEAIGRRVADSALRMPIYVLDDAAAAATTATDGGGETPATKTYVGQMTRAYTDRFSDDMIDVVHFEMSVIIDTTAIIDLVNELQSIKTSQNTPRNQITVLLMNTKPINLTQEQAAGYFYGGGSLTELRLIGEYVFFHQGYDKIMPEPVKLDLKPQAETAAVN